MPTYPLTDHDADDLRRRFTYHAPRGDQPQRFESIRARALDLARLICTSCPDSRERSLSLTKLDEVVMHANSAIARREFSAPPAPSIAPTPEPTPEGDATHEDTRPAETT